MTRGRAQTSLAESVVRAFVEGDVLALQGLVTPNVIDHSPAAGQPTGWPGMRERAMTLCATLPEGNLRVEVLSTDGDTVLARAELIVVRRGADPVGAPVSTALTMVLVLRFAEHLLTELWTSPDPTMTVSRNPFAVSLAS